MERNPNEIPIGIDLGTTFSSMGFFNENSHEIEFVKFTQSNGIYPSVIEIKKCGNGEWKAKNPDSNPTIKFYDSKRLIGKTYEEYLKIGEEKESWTFDVIKDEETNLVKMKMKQGNSFQESFYPEEISGFILMRLLQEMKSQVRDLPIGEIVITVPVDFNLIQKQATLRACELAGLNRNRVTLLDEPTASLIQYCHYIQRGIHEGDKIVVVDFGGGTFDICCAEIEEEFTQERTGKIKVVAKGGDSNLGGNDFDRIVMDLIKKKIINKDFILDEDYVKSKLKNEIDEMKISYEEREEKKNEINKMKLSKETIDKEIEKIKNAVKPEELLKSITIEKNDKDIDKNKKNKNLNKLKKKAEEMKIELSANNSSESESTYKLQDVFGDDGNFDISIKQKEFEEECIEANIIERLETIIKETVRRTGWNTEDITYILPIGGSCKIPIVRKTIIKIFEDENKLADKLFDPLTAVMKGATIRAQQIQNGFSANLKDILYHPINLCLHQGRFHECIRKGINIPTQKYSINNLAMPRNYLKKVIFNFVEGDGNDIDKMKTIRKIIVPVPKFSEQNEFMLKIELEINEKQEFKVNVYNQRTGRLIEINDNQEELRALFDEMKRHCLPFI